MNIIVLVIGIPGIFASEVQSKIILEYQHETVQVPGLSMGVKHDARLG